MHKTFLACALAALTALPALRADDTAPSFEGREPIILTPPAPNLTPERKAQLLEGFGWYLAVRDKLDGLGLSKEETESFIKGMRLAMDGQSAPYPLEEIAVELEPFLTEKASSFTVEWDKKNKAYLLEIDKEKGVQRTSSGLRYKIIEKGGTPVPTAASTVSARYKGTLMNGRVFDSTEFRNNEPVSFPLSGVIPGWTEGLQLIGKGGKIQLYIPQDLGYGTQSTGGIPAMSTLVFEVELVDVMATPPPPAPAPNVAVPDGK